MKQLCQQYTFTVSRHINQSMRQSDISDLQQCMEFSNDKSHAALLQSKKTSLGNLLGVRAQEHFKD